MESIRELYRIGTGPSSSHTMGLVSKIIDIATAHANSLGIGNPSMAAMNRGWVLSRITLEMEGYPRVDSTYTLTTWVESWTRHFSERIIMIADENGNPYGFCRTLPVSSAL